MHYGEHMIFSFLSDRRDRGRKNRDAMRPYLSMTIYLIGCSAKRELRKRVRRKLIDYETAVEQEEAAH